MMSFIVSTMNHSALYFESFVVSVMFCNLLLKFDFSNAKRTINSFRVDLNVFVVLLMVKKVPYLANKAGDLFKQRFFIKFLYSQFQSKATSEENKFLFILCTVHKFYLFIQRIEMEYARMCRRG